MFIGMFYMGLLDLLFIAALVGLWIHFRGRFRFLAGRIEGLQRQLTRLHAQLAAGDSAAAGPAPDGVESARAVVPAEAEAATGTVLPAAAAAAASPAGAATSATSTSDAAAGPAAAAQPAAAAMATPPPVTGDAGQLIREGEPVRFSDGRVVTILAQTVDSVQFRTAGGEVWRWSRTDFMSRLAAGAATPESTAAAEPPPALAAAAAAPGEPGPETVAASGVTAAVGASPDRAPTAPAAGDAGVRQPDALDGLVGGIGNRITRWLTTGNIPVKAGIVLSLIGLAFFLVEAVDRGWIFLPIEARLILVTAFGGLLLGIGWRLREHNAVYALSLQGGGIAVIYLTVFSAYSLFGLIPALPAFALMLVVTLAGAALAVLQNALALAVLAVAGGFMAPLLTATGQGSHVALFGFYTILNLGVFSIAWFRAWRLLNLVGFGFTFGIATTWGYLAYTPANFATTEPFLLAFVAMYLVIPVLFAQRVPPRLKGWVDGTLVFGTPIAGFGLQSQLVAERIGLVASALALAAIYVGLATWLIRRRPGELRILAEAYFGLAIAFLVLAVPLAVDAQWTAVGWALQGAAMVWLGTRQSRRLPLAAGVLLQVAALVAVLRTSLDDLAGDMIFLNPLWLTGLTLASAAIFTARCFDRIAAAQPGNTGAEGPAAVAWVATIWGIGLWLVSGLDQVSRFIDPGFGAAASLLFVVVSTWLGYLLAIRLAWRKPELVALTLLPWMAVGCADFLASGPNPLAGLGLIAWPAAFVSHALFLRLRESDYPGLRSGLHAAGCWLLAVVVGYELFWQIDRYTDGIWALAGTVAALAAGIVALADERLAVHWPVRDNLRAYVLIGAGPLLALIALVAVFYVLFDPGAPAPLPYIPLLNPLELMAVFVLFAGLRWLGASVDLAPGLALSNHHTRWLVAGYAFLLLTMMVARSVHHFAGVPFDVYSLPSSNVFQASLSIVWGLTGLLGMAAGASTGLRSVWVVGAGLMAVVVVKLFLVELGDTGTVTRIVSFLGVGVLLLVVGYLAPVPPRQQAAAGAPAAEEGQV